MQDQNKNLIGGGGVCSDSETVRLIHRDRPTNRGRVVNREGNFRELLGSVGRGEKQRKERRKDF